MKITLAVSAAISVASITFFLLRKRKSKNDKIIATVTSKFGKDALVLFPGFDVYPPLSPSVCKLHTFLKVNGIKFESMPISSLSDSPSGKIPFIYHNGQLITDSHFIILYLVEAGLAKHPDAWLKPTDRALSHIVAKTAETSLDWSIAMSRWESDINWVKVKKAYFGNMSFFITDFLIRPSIRKSLSALGCSRYVPKERFDFLSFQLISDFSAQLGSKRFLFGESMCEADYSLYGRLSNIYYRKDLSPELAEELEKYMNLIAYVKRIKELVGQ